MKTIALILLFFASAFASTATSSYKTEDNVLILDQDSFGTALDEFRTLILLFHTPNPKSSGLLSKDDVGEEFASAAGQALKQLPGIRFGKMDGEEFSSYAKMYGVTELPSIQFITGAKSDVAEYKGEKTADEILSWAREKLRGKIAEITTVKELEKVLEDNKHVGVYLGPASKKTFNDFVGATTLYKDIFFVSTNSIVIKSELDVSEGTFIIYRNRTFERNDIDGDFTLESLRQFIDCYRYPALASFNNEVRKRIIDDKKDGVILIGDTGLLQTQLFKDFQDFSEAFRDKFAFTYGIYQQGNGAAIAEYLGIYPDSLPVVIILNNGTKKYRLDRDLTYKNIGIFLLNFYFDNLRPFYKSSPLPEEEYEGNIKIIVSSTFKGEVLENDYDVLVEFYSPKCKRCQAFAPIYAAAASKLASTSNLLIAKVDGTANEIEGIELEGFPALLYFPRGNKSAYKTYKGDLSEKSVIDFAKSKGDSEI